MHHDAYGKLSDARRSLRRDLEALRAAGAAPRLHPNGFIQVDLSPDPRAHVWPEAALPTADPYCPIHDHTYGFFSLVTRGSVRNIDLEAIAHEAGEYRLWEIKQWADERRTPTPRFIDDKRYALRPLSDKRHFAGTMYGMRPFVFHYSDAEPGSVTIIKILPSEPGRAARIAAQLGDEPDNRFERDVPMERQAGLWDQIFRTIP